MKIAKSISFFLVLASVAFTWTTGCSRPRQTRPVAVTSTRVADDPVIPVSDLLRSGADVEHWRTYVQQLNRYLREHPNAQPHPLSQDQREFLTKELRLDNKELAELENSTFTPLDAHYLDLAFVLRDAVRALRIDGLPPLDQVKSAFSWVVRQVRLREGEAILVPPLPVLHRGWGDSHERALVFLALLDQLGIDGCMITLPAEKTGDNPRRDWVPGARIGNEIYLFDTRLGLPLPGPDSQKIATLAQVRAGIDLRQLLSPTRERGNVPRSQVGLKSLDKFPYDVGPQTSRQAEVQVAYSLSSLAPRMEFLQNYLAGNEKINLGIDPLARYKRVQAAAGTVRVCNPPALANNSLRVLRAFLPPEEGGVAQQPLRTVVQQQEIPFQYLPAQLGTMPGKPGQRLRMLFAAPFVYFSLETRMPPEQFLVWLPGLSEESADRPGTRKISENLLRSPLPRDLLLHGRLDEATKLLVAMHEELERQKALPSGPQLDAKVRSWCERALAAHADLIRAEQAAGGKDAAPTSAVAVARERINQLWGSDFRPVSVMLQRSMAEPMLDRVVYLLALCKQEKAECLQVEQDQAGRLNRSLSPTESKDLADAWKSAASWWKSYLGEHGSAPAAPKARLLRARALQALGDRQAAVALLQDLSGISIDLEKTSRLYQAEQLQAP